MKHNTTPQRPSSLPPETPPRCRALSSIPVVRGIITAIGWRHCLFDFQFSNHFKRFLRILNLSNGHPAALHHPSAPIDCYRKNRLCDVQFVSKTATDRSTKEGGRRPVLQSFGESYTLDARRRERGRVHHYAIPFVCRSFSRNPRNSLKRTYAPISTRETGWRKT